ncbi:MAG: TonB-dependent receptor, partial [Terriglobia bacterium]
PMNGRNWTQLQQLEPGVVASSDRFGTFSTNGAESQQNAFLINGVDTNDAPLNTAGILPSPDALGEFRMITSTINPEFGRNSGAILNAVIKSGNNQFHGDAFEFYRDTTLNARSFFQKVPSPFHQNQFGGTIGGPIWKDHTFFFFSYQGTRNAVPQTYGIPTVFSAAERAGTWPGLTTAAGVSAFPLAGDNGQTYPAGTAYSTIFSNGTIPSADLNPLALKLMNQYVPLPNSSNNQFVYNPTTTGLQDQYITRIDHTFSSKDSIWGTWFWQRNPTSDTLPFTGPDLPGFGDTNARHQQTYAVDWNHVFNGTTLNEARLGYYRFNYVAVGPSTIVNPTSYGFTGIVPQAPQYASIPLISLTGLFNIGFSTNGPQPRIDQTYDLTDNFSKIAGNHTFKAGLEMERFQVYNPFYGSLNGSFSYSGSGTFSTGVPGADFLLGVPDSYSQGSGNIINARARDYGVYFQDQWKVKPTLTLTYGVNWQIISPWEDLYNAGIGIAEFRPGQQSTVFPTAPVGLVYPGDTGINTAGGPGNYFGAIGPRFGFAWTPHRSSNWSVRGGFGVYYNRAEEELALQDLGDPPFSLTTPGAGRVGASPGFVNPYSGYLPTRNAAGQIIGASPISTPIPFPFSAPKPGSNIDFSQYEPLSISVLSPGFGVPMSENYNLTIERQLGPSTVLSVGYVGNVGHHEEGAYELNPPGQAPGVNPGAVALKCDAFNVYTCDPGSFRFNPSVFGSVGQQATDFNSNYNSLQVSLNRHFSHGLQFLVAYTWSRYFDQTSNFENNAFLETGGINPFDFSTMYAPSANDAPQRLVLSYIYTLPFYHFFHHARPLVDGWNLEGITTFQHGFPDSIQDSSFASVTCNVTFFYYGCPDRPNIVSTPSSLNPRTATFNGQSHYWINPADFAAEPVGAIGNSSRNPFYGPGIDNWDISLLKDIHITESKYFEIRVESFDAFNVAQFGSPIADKADPRFGRINSVILGSTSGSGRVFQLAGKFYF